MKKAGIALILIIAIITTALPGFCSTLAKVTPKKDFSVAYTAGLLSGGGLSLNVNGDNYTVETEYSIPNSGLNKLLAGGTSSGEWSVTTTTLSDTHYRIDAVGLYYTLERHVYLHPDRIDFADSITNNNTSDTDAGIIIKNIVNTNQVVLNRCYLIGREMAGNYYNTWIDPAHPTVFAVAQNSGVGIIAVDDVYRLHSKSTNASGRMYITDDRFMLAPNATYLMEWSIYPNTSGSYWDFVNAVRVAWNVNFEIDGGAGMWSAAATGWTGGNYIIDYTQQELFEWFDLGSYRYGISGIPLKDGTVTYAHGSGLVNQCFIGRQLMRDVTTNMHNAHPDAEVLVYMHCFVSTENNASTFYSDSRILKEDGTQLTYHNPIYPEFYPTLTNSYGAILNQFDDIVFDYMQADGIYWDEMTSSAISPSDFFTFDGSWDGHSARIDPTTYTVTKKLAHVTLLSQPYKTQLIQGFFDRGKKLIGNSMPVTKTMTQMHFTRFQETAYLERLRRGHLYTPVGLGDHFIEDQETSIETDVFTNVRNMLDYGCLYYSNMLHYYRMSHKNMMEHVYPITPIEVHPGYVIGKEKIVTKVSASYSWGDVADIICYLYDENGYAVAESFNRFRDSTGASFIELYLPVDYVAILERVGKIDASVAVLANGNAQLSWPAAIGNEFTVNYSDGLLSWNQAGVVTASDTVAEWIDDGTQTASPPQNGSKRFYRVEQNR